MENFKESRIFKTTVLLKEVSIFLYISLETSAMIYMYRDTNFENYSTLYIV